MTLNLSLWVLIGLLCLSVSSCVDADSDGESATVSVDEDSASVSVDD